MQVLTEKHIGNVQSTIVNVDENLRKLSINMHLILLTLEYKTSENIGELIAIVTDVSILLTFKYKTYVQKL